MLHFTEWRSVLFWWVGNGQRTGGDTNGVFERRSSTVENTIFPTPSWTSAMPLPVNDASVRRESYSKGGQPVRFSRQRKQS